MRLISIGLLAMLVIVFPLAGCSETTEPVSVPKEKISSIDETGFLTPLHFIMEFDKESGTVTIKPNVAKRSADWDVTDWAEIVILDSAWNSAERNWYISAQLKNTSPLTGYGVWVVFSELGQKIVRNIDGFTYHGIDEKRVPFVALKKGSPNREFPGFAVDTHFFVIHWPPEVQNWAPIEFYIDAYWPAPRKTSMVEDLEQVNFTPPCYHYAIRATVTDHQSPSGDLDVWADLSSYGEGDHVQMYDDGQHDDLESGDNVFGIEFGPGSIFGSYTFTIYAQDPQGNMMENDLEFYPIEFPPMPPIVWETIVDGDQSGIHNEVFEVITDDTTWTEFWTEHGSNQYPPPDKPVIDFEQYMVAVVMIGARSNGCYDTEITNVWYSSENCGIMVNYKEVVPELGCPCLSVIVYPYHFIKVPKSQFEYGFKGVIEPLICDDCLDFAELDKGNYCNYDSPNEWIIDNQDDLQAHYNMLFGPDFTAPVVDFEQKVVVSMTQGEKNSSGYYLVVNEICEDADGNWVVDYNRMIPGPTCNVLWVFTQPYIILVVDKNPGPILFNANDVVYDC